MRELLEKKSIERIQTLEKWKTEKMNYQSLEVKLKKVLSNT